MDKYQAAMILSAVGDAIGYKNASWKTNNSGANIAEELDELGGIEALKICPKQWPVSASTVMHMATARGLVQEKETKENNELFNELARKHVEYFETASHRHPDLCYKEACSNLHPGKVFGWHVPFNPRGTGYGAATKAMCIGLVYSKPSQVKNLVLTSTECGRMTHNHPVGFTGAVCTALFTSYILQSKPITSWGRDMLECLDLMKTYCKKSIRHNDEYRMHWLYFEAKWEIYLNKRGIAEKGQDSPCFPTEDDVEARDKMYKSWSSEGISGRRGHDAPMIAYDALLMAQQSKLSPIWKDLCLRAMIHGGDGEATGAIAGFWYGLMYGMEGVPTGHHENVEFREKLEELGERLYELANQN